MMQDPQGRPAQGAAPQGPVSPPRLPPLEVPPIGPDSPPALGLIQDPTAAPPPIIPPLDLPPVMPEDPAELEALLMRTEQQVKNMVQVADYQMELEIAQGVQQGPMVAADLQQRMRLDPEAADYDAEIDAAEPYLPKSQTGELRASRKRYTEFRDRRKQFRTELEQELRTAQPGDLKKGPKAAPADLPPLPMDDSPESQMARLRRPLEQIGQQTRMEDHRAHDPEAAAGGAGLRDIGRGLISPVTNETTVEDEMFGRVNRLVDRMAPRKVEPVNPMTAMGEHAGRLLGERPEVDRAVRDAERAALTEEGMRVVRQLKAQSTGKDIVSGAAGVVPWALTGAGEIAVGAKVAQTLIKGTGVGARVARAAIKYVGVPGIAESAIAAEQPLPPPWQAEIEATEDPARREAVEGAYRFLQVSQAFATSTLFSMSDVLRGSLGKEVAAGAGKQALQVLGMGAAAPAVVEGTNWLVGEGAKAARSGDVTTADALADIHASGRLAGPGSALVKAFMSGKGIVDAAADYAAEAAPMWAGMTTVHLATALGGRFRSRGQMLAMNRQIDKEVDALDLEPEVKDALKSKLRQETEAMAPTHAEDERRANQETVDDEYGDVGNEVVSAHELAGELLPDVPGATVEEKAAAAKAALEASPEDPGAVQRAEIADRLLRAQRAGDPQEATLETAGALKEAAAPEAAEQQPKPPDEIAGDENLRRNLAIEENPAARDRALADVADDSQAVWQVADRDDDAGTVTLRRADDPSRRLTVSDKDLGRYKLEEAAAAEPPARSRLEDLQVAEEEARQKVLAAEKKLRRARQQFATKGDEKGAARLKKAEEDANIAGRMLKRQRQAVRAHERELKAQAKKAGTVKARPRRKSMLTRMREMGGIAHASWGDPATKTYPGEVGKDWRGKGIFRGPGEGGMRWEEMAHALRTDGYAPPEANDRSDAMWLVDALDSGEAGKIHSELDEGSAAERRRLEREAAAAMGSRYEPGPEPKVVDDLYGTAESIAAGMAAGNPDGAVTVTVLQKALGVSRNRSLKIAQQLVENGVLRREGKRYVLHRQTVDAPPVIAESDARDRDIEEIRRTLFEDVAELYEGREVDGDRLLRNLADYGDLARPDNPTEGRAQMVAHMLVQLPPELRTDELIAQLGFDDPALVRAMIEQAEGPTLPAGALEPARPPEASPMQQAAERPVTDPLPDIVREAAEESPEAAWSAWAADHPTLRGMQLEDAVRATFKLVNDLHKRMLSKKEHVRLEALEQLGELLPQFDDADQLVALYSLTEMGRDTLARLEELRGMITTQQVVRAPKKRPKKAKQAREDAAAEKASEDWLDANDPDRRGEGGFIDVSFMREVLLTPVQAAQMFWRLARAGWRAAWKAGYKARDVVADLLTFGPAELLRKLRREWRGKQNAANRIAERAAAAVSRNAGSGDWGGVKDQLSAWGETDAVLAAEHSGRLGAIAVHMRDVVSKELLRQDSELDHTFNEWLRVKGIPEPDPESDAHQEWRDQQRWAEGIEAGMTPKQREVAEALRESYAADLDLIANGVHPEQVHRAYNLKVLGRVRAGLQAEIAARQGKIAAELARIDTLDADEAEALTRRVKSMGRAVSAIRAALATADQRVATIENQYLGFLQRWGIRREGYAPHIAARDPRDVARERATAIRRRDSGAMGALMGLPDMAAAAEQLTAIGDALPEQAREHIHNPVPIHLKGGHMQKRKGKLEASENRDPSALRSFFHYKHELYRLLPAVDFMRNHMERIHGELHPVTMQELRKGELVDGTHEVQLMTDEDPTHLQTSPRRRIGGQVYELHLRNLRGKTITQHYGNPKAREAAMKDKVLSPEQWAAKLEEAKAWKPTPEQKRYAEETGDKTDWRDTTWFVDGSAKEGAPWEPKIVLLDSRFAVDDTRAPRISTDEDGRVHLPRFGATTHWPSQLLGRVVKKVGGARKAILERKNGKALERQFLTYHEEVQRAASGRAVLTKAEKWAQMAASIASHKLMGLMNPGSAINELLGGVAANLGMGRMPFAEALDASMLAMEYQGRLWGAETKLRDDPAAWLREHTPRMIDGKHLVVPESVVKAMRTAPEKLERMRPAQRERTTLKEDAFQFLAESMLSGESAIDYFAMGSEPVSYTKVGMVDAAIGKVSRAAGKASWALRRMASTHNMRSTLIGAYMTQRRAGKTDAEARQIATHYALAQGNIQNRVSQSRFMSSWFGRLLKPAYGWQAAVSATNFRYLFHQGLIGGVSRVAAMAANLWWWQQVGYLFGVDPTRWLGTGVSELPVVAPVATWSTRKLQAAIGLAADPEDKSRTNAEPQWKQKLRGAAEAIVPQAYHELVARKMRTLGTSVDPVLPPLWGTSLPWTFDAMKNTWDAAWNTWNGNEPAAAQAWARAILGQHAFVRIYDRVWGARPDPSDPSFVLTRHPTTEVTLERVRKEAAWKMLLNVLTPDPQQTFSRVERMLEGQRTQGAIGEARTIADNAQSALRRSIQHEEEAMRASSSDARVKLAEMAERGRKEFLAAVLEEGRRRELSTPETRALYRQWEKVARTKEHLTAQERNVLNAYDADTGFSLMTDLLNDPVAQITKQRYDRISALWYDDVDAMKNALRRTSSETQRRFLSAWKQARARWQLTR